MSVVLAVLALTATAACDESRSSSSTSTAEVVVAAEGPCALGIDRYKGQSGLTVAYGDQTVAASLNSETLEYCPGHELEGSIASEADGFLADVANAVIQAEPGALIEIRGPGYPGATLTATAEVEDTHIDEDGGRAWHIRVPAEAGEHEIRLSLHWQQGKAQYVFLATTAPATFGPARLEAARNGLQAHGKGDSQVYFHLGGPAQGYGDGAGGIVYQTLDQWRRSNTVDVMWLPVGAGWPQVAVAAGLDSQALQGVDRGRVLTLAASEEDSNGMLPEERKLVLTDLASGESKTLMSIGSDEDTGIGRASIRDDRIAVSLRSLECTWFEFIDTDGTAIEDVRNPRPEAEACGGRMATGAVLLEDNLIAYVESGMPLSGEFSEDGNPHHVRSFTRVPVQTIVVRSLDDGKTLYRVPVEPSGSLVEWLEPEPGGVAVSLGSLNPGGGEIDSSRLPILLRAPILGDIGSDLGMSYWFGDRAGAMFVAVADGEPTLRDWWFATTIESVRGEGVCSAVFTESEMGPPSGVTGLGVDVPITLYELTPEADATRDAIRVAALACDYESLEKLVTVDRPSPAFFSGPEADELADHWRDLENSGEFVMAILAEVIRYQPTGENPFWWDATRGDMMFSNAAVSINADGDWIGFQVP